MRSLLTSFHIVNQLNFFPASFCSFNRRFYGLSLRFIGGRFENVIVSSSFDRCSLLVPTRVAVIWDGLIEVEGLVSIHFPITQWFIKDFVYRSPGGETEGRVGNHRGQIPDTKGFVQWGGEEVVLFDGIVFE